MPTNTHYASIVFAGIVLGLGGCTEQAQDDAKQAAEKTAQVLGDAADAAKRETREAMAKIEAATSDSAANQQEDLPPTAEQPANTATETDSGEPIVAQPKPATAKPSAESATASVDAPSAAIAVLVPTVGNKAKGKVNFTIAANGLQVSTTATGLPPGKHGYHVHLYGDCSAPDATSAGTHFNFVGSSQNPPAGIDRITGNLGDLNADNNGNARHEAVIENAKLSGPKSIIGRAVVVHAKANDANQPPIGAAGARVACGVIGIAESQ